MKKRIVLFLIISILAVIAVGCGQQSEELQGNVDEIKVMIRLKLKEDIGLLVLDYDVNGQTGGGGIFNADRSMLKRNSNDLVWDYDRGKLEQPADEVGLRLQFTVVTKYYEPNYENNYPKKDMIPMEAISFQASFGEVYYVTITGSRAEGYQAVLEQP